MPGVTQLHPHAWRVLLACAALSIALHLVLLAVFGPRVGDQASSIAQPLVYTLAPAAAPAPASKTAPAPRPRKVRPAPALAVPQAAVESTEPAVNPPPAPPEPIAEPAPEPVAERVAAPVAEPTAAPAPEPRAPALPGSQRLKYTVEGGARGMTYHAEGELLWAHDGQNYEVRMEVGAFLLGSRVQSSRGQVTPQGLQPQRFTDISRRQRVAEFDHAQALVRFSEGAAPVALQPGAQDQLSIFVQLASQLAADPGAFPRGSTLTLQAIGVRGADTWRFVVGEEEALPLPGGEQRALKLSRLTQAAQEVQVELWLAPALGWLPARIRLSQPNGDFIDQRWRASAAP